MNEKPTYDELLKKVKYYEDTNLITDVNSVTDIDTHIKHLKSVNNIINGSPSIIYVTNIENYTLKYVSNNIETLTGYSAKDFLTNNITLAKLIHPNDLETHKLDLAKKNKNNSLTYNPYRIVCKSGEVKWVEDTVTIVRDKNGEALYSEGIVTDITKHKNANEKLTQLTNIIESTASVVFLVKNEQNFPLEYVSNNVEQLFGFTAKEFLKSGFSFFDLIYPDDFEVVVHNLNDFKVSESIKISTKSFRCIGKNGNIKWVKVNLRKIKDKSGNITHFESVFIDITKLKKVEQALLKQNQNFEILNAELKIKEQNYRLLFEENPISLWEEDFTYIYHKIKNLYTSGVKDVEKYLIQNPKFYIDCFSNIKISNVNNASVKLFKAKDKETLINNIHRIRTKNTLIQYEKILEGLLNDKKEIIHEVVFKNFLDEDVVGIVKVNLFHDRKKNELKAIISISDITERVKTEKALLKSEEKFRNIVENTSEWIWELNTKGEITYSNPIVKKILGYSPEELIGKNNFALISKFDRKRILKIFLDKIEKKEGWINLEISWTHKNGNHRFLESNAVPIVTDEGVFIGFRGINSDITERKEAEKEMKKLSTVIEQSANSIIITNIEGSIEYVNKKFTEITGYSYTEVIGKNPRILNSGTQPKEYFKDLWETIKNGGIWEGQFINKTKNGNLFWEETTITPIKNNQGDIVNFVAIKQDITELKKNELDLKESERKLVDAHKIAQIGTYFLDLKSQIFTSSFIFDQITGFKTTDTKTFAVWRTIIHPDDSQENQKILRNCIENREKFDREYRIFTKDTMKLKWLHGIGEITYKEDEPISFSGTIQDITERKNSEIKIKIQNKILKKAKEKAEESDKLKTEFLNNMSHEIRTPLNGILGFTEILCDSDTTEDKRKYFGNIIKNSGNQLMQVIDDILEISRLGTKQVKANNKEVCLNTIMLQLFLVFEIRAKENKIPLYLKNGLLDAESTIKTDELKLNKILSNLLENAFKFTNEGHIEFGYILNNSEPAQLEIFVKDTGVGINKINQKTIFDRFSQEEKELSKKFGGLGLGLSIAKENSELLGGTITLESEKGKGATFTVTIPYTTTNQTFKISKENITSKTNKAKPTILIAEDEEVNYLFLETLLQDSIKLDCTILHAKNGIEAVELCKSNSAINLVLMDIKMPHMNGFEATKLIKEMNPNLPIIAQTAYSTSTDINKSIEVGCNDFISKPISKKTLNEILNKHLIIKSA